MKAKSQARKQREAVTAAQQQPFNRASRREGGGDIHSRDTILVYFDFFLPV